MLPQRIALSCLNLDAQLSENDIHAKTGESMDKTGSYGIQGIGGQMIECAEGDFFAVVGRPMHRLRRGLARALMWILFSSFPFAHYFKARYDRTRHMFEIDLK